MASYWLWEDGGRITLQDASGFWLLDLQDVGTSQNPTQLGGGEEELQRARSERNRRLEARQAEAEELRRKLVKAEQDRARKAKAKSESKARKAIEARIDRFTRELAEAEADITVLLQALAELQIQLVDQELIRRRRLLMIAICSA